ncbi:MAG: Tm-1-like ATP-binding domain-containing protein, partial [Tabrizicola sp.]
MTKCILVIGTFDTKADELGYLIGRIRAQGGAVLAMDVSILGEARIPVDVGKHEVAAAAGETIEGLIALGEEGEAFARMSAGAATLTRRLYDAGRFQGMIALGGTMGTDLALDCAQALPL